MSSVIGVKVYRISVRFVFKNNRNGGVVLTKHELRKLRDEKISAVMAKYSLLFEPYEYELLKLRRKRTVETDAIQEWYKVELEKLEK